MESIQKVCLHSNRCSYVRPYRTRKPHFLQGLTWQIQLLHLFRSTSVLGLTSDIVWTEEKGPERTQSQQLGWSAWSLSICLRGKKFSGQSWDPSLFPLSEKHKISIGEAAVHIDLYSGNSHEYTFGCTYWDNKQDTLSKSNICGNIVF